MAFPSPSQFAGGRVMGRSYPLQGAQRCTVQSMVGGWWLILLAEWWQTSTVLSHCSMVESKNNAKETSKNKSSSIKWDTSNTMQSRRSPHQSPNPPEHVELYTTNKCDWCPNRFQWGYFGHKVSNAALVDKGDTSPFFTSIEIDWYTKMPSGNEWLIHGTSIWIPYELWTYGWQISQIPVVFFSVKTIGTMTEPCPDVPRHKVAAQHEVAAHRQAAQLGAADQLLPLESRHIGGIALPKPHPTAWTVAGPRPVKEMEIS